MIVEWVQEEMGDRFAERTRVAWVRGLRSISQAFVSGQQGNFRGQVLITYPEK